MERGERREEKGGRRREGGEGREEKGGRRERVGRIQGRKERVTGIGDKAKNSFSFSDVFHLIVYVALPIPHMLAILLIPLSLPYMAVE